MEEHLAHQNEKRNRCQREIDHRCDAVAGDLVQAGIAAEKQNGADQVDGNERNCHRHSGKEKGRGTAEEQHRGHLPGHAHRLQ